MATQGPTLPPHLAAKRKRQGDGRDSTSSSSGEESEGSKKRRVAGPALPPASEDPQDKDTKRRKEDDSDDSSDDDDYGPSLPGAGSDSAAASRSAFDDIAPEPSTEAPKSKRDEWMTMPPTQDDLAARMDPTKQRARGFNTGRSAKGAGGAGANNAIWTETPEQRQKRLRDEVMGVKSSEATGEAATKDLQKQRQDEDKARKIKEHNEKHRGQSLYSKHQGTSKSKEEDDPSRRAFDYEKDMSSGPKIGHSQKRELLKKSSDFGSRFSSGKYL